MGSKARAAFDQNAKDVNTLVEIHTDLGNRGNKSKVEVLNRSAIVLTCAIWEAYCEDIAAEAVEHVVKNAVSDDLSKDIRRLVAQELKAEKHELAIWDLAGDGWRKVLMGRLEKMRHDRNRSLNTPKAEEIQSMFNKALGIEDVTKGWHWKGVTVPEARSKLDKYITLRGEIAHRGSAVKSVTRRQVADFLNHVTTLVRKTGGTVNTCVKTMTKKPLW